MKTTITPTVSASLPTPVRSWVTAPERLGVAPIGMTQGTLLPSGSYLLGTGSHVSAFAGVRNDADGVPPRGRPV